MKLHTKYQRPRPSCFREDFSSVSQYIVFLCETCGLWRGAIFDPRAIVWIILVDVCKIKQHSKYQRPGPSSFREEYFLNFAYRNLCKKWPFCKKTRSPKGYIFFQTQFGPCPKCCILIPRAIDPMVPEKRNLWVFYHIWTWQPSGSCDADAANKLSFPLSIENPYEILRWFLKRRRLKSFPYISLCTTSDPRGGAIFNPRATIWTKLVEVYKINLHTKYQRPRPCSFRQEEF